MGLLAVDPPTRRGAGAGNLLEAILAVGRDRRRGDIPPLEDYWSGVGPEASVTDLAALVKADLQCRYTLGERPEVAEYLERFSILRETKDRVVSLVYEEFCLREERGDRPDPDRFCERYEPWRDSLESQLRYHRMLSQIPGLPPPKPKFPEPGERFLKFRLDSVLGRGGAAWVYLAADEELGGRRVALKVSPDRGEEASIQGRLEHDHIVPVLSVAHQPETGLRGLCMPYRPCQPLDEVIRRVDPASRPRSAMALWKAALPDQEAEGADPASWDGFPAKESYERAVAWVVATLAEALAYAHEKGIFHRDVKPANVLMTLAGGPQLLDFNLAHAPHAADQADAALRGGTLPYMAPEQLEAFLDPDRWGAVGAPADLYALGLLLVELLTGRRPDGPDIDLPLPRAIRELLDRRQAASAPFREPDPAVSPSLEAIARRCLAYRPEDRYADARDLAEDLRCFHDRRPLRHAPNNSKAELIRNGGRRHRLAIAGAAGVLALAAVLGWRHATEAERRVASARDHLQRGSTQGAWDEILVARRLRPDILDAATRAEFTAMFIGAGWNHLQNGQHFVQARSARDSGGDFRLAKAEMGHALELTPDSIDAMAGLATAYHQLKDFAASHLWYDALIRIARGPKDREARGNARERFARTLVCEGVEGLDAATPDLDRCDGWFAEAIRQLDRAKDELRGRRSFKTLDLITRGEALSGQGRVAVKRSRASRAADYFREARKVFNDALRLKPSFDQEKNIRSNLKELEQGIDDHPDVQSDP